MSGLLVKQKLAVMPKSVPLQQLLSGMAPCGTGPVPVVQSALVWQRRVSPLDVPTMYGVQVGFAGSFMLAGRSRGAAPQVTFEYWVLPVMLARATQQFWPPLHSS